MRTYLVEVRKVDIDQFIVWRFRVGFESKDRAFVCDILRDT